MEEFSHNRRLKSQYSSASNFGEQFKQQIQSIEKGLNLACSYRDSLMPALQVANLMPSLERWETQLKVLERRIDQQSRALEEIAQKEQRKQEKGDNSAYQAFHRIQNSIDGSNKNVRRIEESLRQSDVRCQYVQNIPEFKSAVDRKLREGQKYTQTCLASFKNQIEMQRKERPKGTRQYSENSKGLYNIDLVARLINNEDFPVLSESVQNLLREIEILRAELSTDYSLQQFHEFNCNRIKCEILQFNETIESLFEQLAEGVKNRTLAMRDKCLLSVERMEEFEVVSERIDALYWQLRGMKKKYLIELTNQYEQNRGKDSSDIYVFQRRLVDDLNPLEKDIELLQHKVNEIKSELS